MLKKTKPGTLCISTLTTVIALCILFCSQPAQAAIECRFNSGKGGSTTLVNGSYKEIRLPTPTSGQSHMIAQFDTKLTPTITGNDSNLLIVFYVQIVPDDFVMQLHRF